MNQPSRTGPGRERPIASFALSFFALICAICLCATVLQSCTYQPLPGPKLLTAEPTLRRSGDVTVRTLTSGLTLIHRQNTANQIVGVVMMIRTGAVDEDAAKNGSINLMMRVLTKGTTTRTSQQISEEMGQMGSSVTASAGHDTCRVSFQSVREDAATAFEILADVIKNPTFPNDQLELEKNKVLSQIRMNEDSSSTQVSKRFQAQLFGTHPYGRPIEGTPETIPQVFQSDLALLHAAEFVPSNMVLSIVGNLSETEAVALAEKHFSDPGPERVRRFNVDKIITPTASRREFSKAAHQGFIMLGTPACGIKDPDMPALEVAAAILGSGMSSRLFTELRDKQGLAYAIGAYTQHHDRQGYFAAYIGTAPANVDKATDGLWTEITKLRETVVSEDELLRTKNYLTGEYLRAHERNSQQAGFLAYWYATGLGVDHDKEYLEAINAVTPRDVMRVANKYFLDPTVTVLRPSS